MKISDTSKQAKAKQEQEEITFPYEYTRPRCSVSFKIYKTPRESYDAFTLI